MVVRDYGADYGADHGADYGADHGADYGADYGADHGADYGADYGPGRTTVRARQTGDRRIGQIQHRLQIRVFSQMAGFWTNFQSDG